MSKTKIALIFLIIGFTIGVGAAWTVIQFLYQLAFIVCAFIGLWVIVAILRRKSLSGN